MIRPLRTAHRLIWVLLAVLLPILFVAALKLRHEPILPGEPPERGPASESTR